MIYLPSIKFPSSGIFLSCWLYLGMLPAARPAMAEEPASGVVLFNSAHQSIRQDVLSEGGKNHYSWPRGPYIENKYCAYRMLLASETGMGAIDPFGKTKYVGILPFFHDPKYSKGAKHDYGYDAYHVGKMAGLGSPMFKVGDDWVMLPPYGKAESIAVELVDTALASPRFRVSYKGWNIDGKQKIDVVLEVFTAWEDRHLHMEMKVEDFSGLVGAGLQAADKLEPVKDGTAVVLYHHGTFQKGKEMLQAVHADPAYFHSFEKDDQGEVMVLKADETGLFKWNALHSWAEEPSPLFKEADWQKKLIYGGTKVEARNPK